MQWIGTLLCKTGNVTFTLTNSCIEIIMCLCLSFLSRAFHWSHDTLLSWIEKPCVRSFLTHADLRTSAFVVYISKYTLFVSLLKCWIHLNQISSSAIMFLSCATRQIENVGLISCVHSLRIFPGLFSASFFFFFLWKQLLVVEQTSLGVSDLALFEVVPRELRMLIVVFSSFCRTERDHLTLSVCILWRALWSTLWGLSRIPWKVCSHTTYCQKGDRVFLFELKKTWCLLGHKYFVATEML